jgi:hypothetical protein
MRSEIIDCWEQSVLNASSGAAPPGAGRLRVAANLGRWSENATGTVRSRDYLQHLADLNLVRVAELVFVGLEDLHVRSGVAIELLRDLREGVSRLLGSPHDLSKEPVVPPFVS